ncbi:MAG: homoserine dehydrogenase [Solobacterium sp.]|nr:homoserine dehydrogenase [Solobacterium sp.]
MKIGLLGHGVVGGGVSKITDSCALKKIRRLEVARILVKDEWEMTDPRCTMNVEDILSDPDIEVVAECMGGIEPARTFAARALEAGKHVVTSNKKMFAACCEELFELAKENNVTIRYEASCGGGIPWISSLSRIRRLEGVDSFEGIFNGTTNYILTRMEETGSGLAENLAEAQSLGYAEKDPTDDLEGYDVRYKTAISSMKAFDAAVSPDAIPAYGIAHVSAEDIAWAKEQGRCLKLIGSGKKNPGSVSLWVMPVFVKQDDVFASVKENFNALKSVSATLGSAVFTGQGAGALPTAHAVVQDLLDIYQRQDMELPRLNHVPVDNSGVKARFYIRTANPEAFAGVKAADAGEHALVTEVLSLPELEEYLKGCGDETVFAAMVKE